MLAIDSLKTLFIVILFSGARLTAALIVAPFFAPEVIPGLVRNVVIFTLLIIVVPITLTTIPVGSMNTGDFVLIIIKEVFIGFVIGTLIGIAFQVTQSVGAFLDTQRGASMGQIFDPMLGGSSTTLGALFTKIITTLFFVGGGFLAFLSFIYQSYVFWPIFSFFPNVSSPNLAIFFLQITDDIMKATVLISAPVSIVMFLTEFGLGMMNRFASQLNVFSLSMPIKSAVAFFILILYSTTLFALFKLQLHDGQKLLETFKVLLS